MHQTDLHAESLQRDVRAAIGEADDLSRRAHAARQEPVAQALDGLRTVLVHVDESLGGGRPLGDVLPQVVRAVDDVARFADLVGPDLRGTYQHALEGFRRLARDLRRPTVGATFLGRPIARLISVEAHALTDYAIAGVCAGSAVAAESGSAQAIGLALAATSVCVGATTDRPFSVAPLLPQPTTVAVDRALGLAMIAAPFVFGYARREPAVAAIHVLAGTAKLLAALFADDGLRPGGTTDEAARALAGR
jgi:hypothetical protein